MPDFTLTIMDESLAAWMPITNTFTIKATGTYDRQRDFWTGVLFQLGHYERIQANAAWCPGFGRMTFTVDGNPPTTFPLNVSDFAIAKATWVNIGRIPAPGTGRSPHTKDPTLAGATDVYDLMLVPEGKSIHKYFHPLPGGITLWHDHGYDLKVTTNPDKGEKYEFTIQRVAGFQVQIWQNTTPGAPPGNWQPFRQADWGAISGISIEPMAGLPTGDKKDPPQRP